MRPFTFSSDRLGVWASRSIAAGETIDEAPVVVLPAVQGRMLAQTTLEPILEEWSLGRGEIGVSFGSIGLYRRGADANAKLVKRKKEMTLDVVATRDIDEGEEVVVPARPPPPALRPHWLWSSSAFAKLWLRGRLLRRRATALSQRRP